MERGQRNNLLGNVLDRPGPVLFSLLLLIAVSLVIINVVYNQPGTHPQPLWANKERLVTHKINQPVSRKSSRKKSSISEIILSEIPVPTLHPERRKAQLVTRTDKKASPVNPTRRLQRMLGQLGYYNGRVDGVLGPQTMSAVRAFERSKGLPQSSEITPSLIILIENAVSHKPVKSSVNIRDLLDSEVENRKKSSATRVDTDMITRVQIGLINFGNDDVTIDGVLNKQTRNAIRQFQTRFKLEVNGVPSQQLIRKLESIGALTSS